jgi:endonuclease/exonuclease/phosphatase family metal-dependent hydrolase
VEDILIEIRKYLLFQNTIVTSSCTIQANCLLLNLKLIPLLSKKFIFILILCLLFFPSFSQSLKILTYNIRYDNPGDGENSWANRRVWLCEQVKQVNPDLFGIQEGLISQVTFLDSAFSDFRHIGVGREDGKTKGEFSAIYYNVKKFRVLKQSTFWLSPTPAKVSVGWDAALERICTYGLFQDMASGQRFWVFNTHFDHMGVQARKNSATLILQKIRALNKSNYPVILTGDFNSGTGNEPIKIITAQLQDSKVADKNMSMGPDGTFNGFDAKKPATERIDFIFTGYGAKAVDYQVMRESRDGRFASDHFAVIAEIIFNSR